MKLAISRQIFEKYSNIRFHDKAFSGSRAVPCGRTDRRTDMTNLLVTFRNSANALKKRRPLPHILQRPYLLRPSSRPWNILLTSKHSQFRYNLTVSHLWDL